MNAIGDLLDRVHAAGATLVRLAPDRLHLLDPESAISAELKAELRAHKAELLEYLAPHPCERCGKFAFPMAGIVCFWCRRDVTRGSTREAYHA